MTESDIIEVESKLGIRVPADYREFMISRSGQEIAGMLATLTRLFPPMSAIGR